LSIEARIRGIWDLLPRGDQGLDQSPVKPEADHQPYDPGTEGEGGHQ
jgi:hypothetical protein